MHDLPKAVVVALLAALSLPALAETSVSRRAEMSKDGTLDVSNVAGEVVITGWDREEVQLSGELGHEQELEFEADGDYTRIEIHFEDEHHGDADDAELRIRVPSTARVRATTVSAEITVEGMTSELRIQSVSGDVRAEVYEAEAEIGSISGTVEVNGHREPGSLRVSVVSGDALVRDVAGELVARTVSGDLDLRASALRRARIDTTSGNVSLRTSLEPGARLEADSTSGDLRFELCGSPGAEYELSSFSGDIFAFDGRRGEPRSEHGPTSELRFEVGDGDGLVRINTLSGNVSLEDC
jgi:hypothetical protein